MQCGAHLYHSICSSVAPPLAGTYLVGDLLDGLYAGSVQVVVVLAGLDELVLLDLSLHQLPGGHEVVISAVHLVVSPWPRRVWCWRHKKKIKNKKINTINN